MAITEEAAQAVVGKVILVDKTESSKTPLGRRTERGQVVVEHNDQRRQVKS